MSKKKKAKGQPSGEAQPTSTPPVVHQGIFAKLNSRQQPFQQMKVPGGVQQVRNIGKPRATAARGGGRGR